MKKTVYRLKKFRLSEISLVDRPACGLATVERIELAKRTGGWLRGAEESARRFDNFAKATLTAEATDALPDSAFAYIEPSGTKDSEGKTVPRSLRHFPIQDAAHVRAALARFRQSKFGSKALPAIIEAADKFGVDVDRSIRELAGKDGTADPDTKEALQAGSGESASDGDSGIQSSYLGQTEEPPNALKSVRVAPDDIRKYVPLTAVPIDGCGEEASNAVTLAEALGGDSTDRGLAQLCDAFLCVAANIVKSGEVVDRRAAVLGALDELRDSVEKALLTGNHDRLADLSAWRAHVLRVERAVGASLRKRALADALAAIGFEWPEGVPAIELIGREAKAIGWLSLDEFRKRGATLSAANRQSLHEARDILIAMCAAAGCPEDQRFASELDNPDRSAPAHGPSHKSLGDPAQLENLLGQLRQAANTLDAAADEVRKVAEASAGSIRKAEGSAKVLSALAERVARLEAQPDNSRPQPLRTVEKGAVFAFYGGTEDGRARIAELENEAAELRKRASDPAAQKRLSEVRLEIIRLANGAPSATRM
jgi:hypothetical protein